MGSIGNFKGISMTLTKRAAHVIQDRLRNRGSGKGIRVGVRSAGCMGFKYTLEYADSIDESDAVFEDRGVNLIVDAKSLQYLSGTQISYEQQEGLNEGFEFSNPHTKANCGCGESFIVN
jgi:iron-sulfur cluster assembly protein